MNICQISYCSAVQKCTFSKNKCQELPSNVTSILVGFICLEAALRHAGTLICLAEIERGVVPDWCYIALLPLNCEDALLSPHVVCHIMSPLNTDMLKIDNSFVIIRLLISWSTKSLFLTV